MNKVKNEEAPDYSTSKPAWKTAQDRAIKLLNKELQQRDCHHSEGTFTSPEITTAYLRISLAMEEREHFHCLFLNNQHQLLQDRRMFSGTIDGSSVYPREVVKAALEIGAAAVIFAHNHPSGMADPSQADKQITEKLKQALALFDIRVLDHFVIGSGEPYSFAEHGLL
jgi:DNA repair protein RadC